MVKDFRFRGIYCPLTTPYKDNLDIDYEDLRNEVEFCVQSGMHGIVTNVNAAEFYTLSDEEHEEITKFTAKQVNNRLPLMAGIIFGTYSSVCITGGLWYVMTMYKQKKVAEEKAAQKAAEKEKKAEKKTEKKA